MIKILTMPKYRKEYIIDYYWGKCNKCGTSFQFEEDDWTRNVYHDRYIICPVCKYKISDFDVHTRYKTIKIRNNKSAKNDN